MAGERILVVKEERGVARGLDNGMAAEGYSVLLAEAGKQAPEMARGHLAISIRCPAR
jgi:DNA-binding response OmpR family regulator